MSSISDGKIAKSFNEHTNQSNAPKLSQTVPLTEVGVKEPPLLKTQDALKTGIETLKTVREDLEAAKKHKDEVVSNMKAEIAVVDAVVTEAAKKAQQAKLAASRSKVLGDLVGSDDEGENSLFGSSPKAPASTSSLFD